MKRQAKMLSCVAALGLAVIVSGHPTIVLAADRRVPKDTTRFKWEYNLGTSYKLMDNLTYESHFGYRDTGNYFKSEPAPNDSLTTQDIFYLIQSLSMTF